MFQIKLLLVLANLGALALAGGGNYWWMDQQEVFSGNGGGHSNVGTGHVSNQNYQDQGAYPDNSAASVQTECPVGTKCVSDFFCDENAIMVNYRVDLTPAQKRQRGDLIPCMNQQTGNFDVCCSTAARPLPINNNVNNNRAQNLQRPPPRNSFQSQQQSFNTQQTSVVSNVIPTGSCPALGSLPSLDTCNGAESNCWSVGQADVDCPGNALCCFDGCRNTCYFGDSAAPAPRPPRPVQQRPASVPQRPAPVPQRPAPVPQRPAPVPQRPAPVPQRPAPVPQRPAPVPQRPAPVPQRPAPVPQRPAPVPQRPAPVPALPSVPAQQTEVFSQSQAESNNIQQCPSVQPLDDNTCSTEKDTCWNTGGQDDCSRGHLCCYDGCAKTCFNVNTQQFLYHPRSQLQGSNQVSTVTQTFNQPRPAPQPVRRPQSTPVRNQQRPRPASQPVRRPQSTPVRNQPAPIRRQQQTRVHTNPATPVRRQQTVVQTQQTYQPVAPPRRKQQTVVSTQTITQHQTRPVGAQRRPVNNFQSQGNQQQNFEPAETKPFVKCPSAMLCVPINNCDYEGFITDQFIPSDPVRDMLRVALINCINPADQNIDVCCRDPNYVDPWPNMNGNNKNMNGNNFRNNNNQGFAPGNNNQGFSNNNQGHQQTSHRSKGYGK